MCYVCIYKRICITSYSACGVLNALPNASIAACCFSVISFTFFLASGSHHSIFNNLVILSTAAIAPAGLNGHVTSSSLYFWYLTVFSFQSSSVIVSEWSYLITCVIVSSCIHLFTIACRFLNARSAHNHSFSILGSIYLAIASFIPTFTNRSGHLVLATSSLHL